MNTPVAVNPVTEFLTSNLPNGMYCEGALNLILKKLYPYDEEVIFAANNEYQENGSTRLLNSSEYKRNAKNFNLATDTKDELKKDLDKLKLFIKNNLPLIDYNQRKYYVLYSGENKRLKSFRNKPLYPCVKRDGMMVYKETIKFPIADCAISLNKITLVPMT